MPLGQSLDAGGVGEGRRGRGEAGSSGLAGRGVRADCGRWAGVPGHREAGAQQRKRGGVFLPQRRRAHLCGGLQHWLLQRLQPEKRRGRRPGVPERRRVRRQHGIVAWKAPCVGHVGGSEGRRRQQDFVRAPDFGRGARGPRRCRGLRFAGSGRSWICRRGRASGGRSDLCRRPAHRDQRSAGWAHTAGHAAGRRGSDLRVGAGHRAAGGVLGACREGAPLLVEAWIGGARDGRLLESQQGRGGPPRRLGESHQLADLPAFRPRGRADVCGRGGAVRG
mmetsp:Transcript_82393/g.209425  ORF Transcript_82393/g.209425 Transcript_82393/m.209425 type:complete len:278 (-) Transcript_82393:700-1533(-)